MDGPQHTWSLEELLDAVRTAGQSADPSSVFRAVVALEREGTLERVELGDGRSHYHARRSHHDHILCRECGAVAEVPSCVVEGSDQRVARATGYAVEQHQLVFSGLCPVCRPNDRVAAVSLPREVGGVPGVAEGGGPRPRFERGGIIQ